MTREDAIQFLTDTGISPEHIMELVEALSSSEKPNKWIPVSERLPKTYSTVCATIKWDLCDLSSIAFGYYTKDEGWQLIDTEGNRCYDFTVIAWMSLPEAYKEGREKE